MVVDEEGDVLKKGRKSAIEVGTKVEFEEGEVEQPEEDESAEDYAESKKSCAEPVEDEQPAVKDSAEEEPTEESDDDSDEEPGDEALVTFEDLCPSIIASAKALQR